MSEFKVSEHAEILIAKLRIREEALALERDKLRELEDEVKSLGDTADEGLENLRAAIDSLSQLV